MPAEVRKVSGVAHSLAWLTRLPGSLAYPTRYSLKALNVAFAAYTGTFSSALIV
jgi:hypothetical protein